MKGKPQATCDFNDTVVNFAPLQIGESLLLRSEGVRALTFNDYGEGQFVRVEAVEPEGVKNLVNLKLSVS